MKLFEKLKSLGGQPWHILSEELLNSLITEAELMERKARAFDFCSEHYYRFELVLLSGTWHFLANKSSEWQNSGNGNSPLEAVEAAMKAKP